MVHFIMVMLMMWFGMGNPWHEDDGGCMRARDLGYVVDMSLGSKDLFLKQP
jgi:hypothetical protein